MKTIDTHGTFAEAISSSNEATQTLARQLRDLIIECYPDVVEVPWPTQQVTGYGIGPRKMSEHFCYIGAYKKHVNLGFNYGALLPDPAGLLKGTGKKFRNVKIANEEILSGAPLRALLAEAIKERQVTLGK